MSHLCHESIKGCLCLYCFGLLLLHFECVLFPQTYCWLEVSDLCLIDSLGANSKVLKTSLCVTGKGVLLLVLTEPQGTLILLRQVESLVVSHRLPRECLGEWRLASLDGCPRPQFRCLFVKVISTLAISALAISARCVLPSLRAFTPPRAEERDVVLTW